MKRNANLPAWWILIAILSLGLSIGAIIIANSDNRCNCEMYYDYEKVTEFVGLLVTVLGVVFSLYFVVVGLKASDAEKEISKILEQIREIENTIIQKQSQINSVEVQADSIKAQIDNAIIVELNQQDEMYGHLLHQASLIRDDKERTKTENSLNLSRAQLATKFKYLSKDKRMQRMSPLEVLGGLTDVDDLDKIIQDPTEDKDIKNLAEVIKKEIEHRFNEAKAGGESPVFAVEAP